MNWANKGHDISKERVMICHGTPFQLVLDDYTSYFKRCWVYRFLSFVSQSGMLLSFLSLIISSLDSDISSFILSISRIIEFADLIISLEDLFSLFVAY